MPQGKHHFVVCDPRALEYATDIDRKKCSRQVPMKVLCFGLGRTGTNSLREALIELGYYDVYHFAALLQENMRDSEMWNEAFEGKFGNGRPYVKEDWDKLLGHCMAVTDSPCNIFAEELVEAYPDCKIILTLRDSPEQWLDSIQRTLLPWLIFFRDQSMLSRFLKFWGPQYSPSMITCLQWCSDVYLSPWLDPTNAKVEYDNHSKRIRNLAKGRLLEFNAKQGWEPLCDFLGEPVPEVPFPRINHGAEWDKHAAEREKALYQTAAWNFSKALSKFVMPVAVVGVGLFFAWKRRADRF